MKKLIEQLTKRGAARPPEGDAAPQDISGCGPDAASQPPEPATPAPKPPPDLPLFFMLSHLDDDGPVRLDGVKLGVCEVMGLEMDEPKLGAFVGALNALDFPVQLLVLRSNLEAAQPQDLPDQTRAAAESLGRISGLENPLGYAIFT